MRFPCSDIAESEESRQQQVLAEPAAGGLVLRFDAQQGGKCDGASDDADELTALATPCDPVAAFQAVLERVAISRRRARPPFGNIIVRRFSPSPLARWTLTRLAHARSGDHAGRFEIV